MKRSIALIIVTIMILSIAAVAFAACNHSWYTVSVNKTLIKKETIACQHGCTKTSIPHFHTKRTYKVTQRFVCSKGCGETYLDTYTTSEVYCPY